MNRENNENSRNQEDGFNNRVSIRDIEISERRKEFDNRYNNMDNRGVSYKKKNRKLWPKVLISLVVLLLLFVFATYFFHSATVEVTPKKEKLVFSDDIYRATVSDSSLVGSQSGTAEEKKISVGKIKILNKTGKVQKLRKETRFKIDGTDIVYKTFKAVAVPAKGSVVAEAFSVGAGEKFNQKAGTKLVVPGFAEAKMDEEYQKITGVIEEDFKTSDIDLDANRPAVEKGSEGALSSKDELEKALGSVKYKVLEIADQKSKEVASIGVEKVEEKAKGKIRIFNKTSKTQKLRKETRFQNGDLIFKTFKSVTIPAGGSVVAEAFADEAGEKGNIAKGTKFTIPGFTEAKMDEEYQKITGEAESDFSGGKKGEVLVPNKDELAKAKEELKKDINASLELKLAKDKNREDYIFLEDGKNMSYSYDIKSGSDKVTVVLKAIEKLPIIAKKDFIRTILKSEEIEEKDLDSLVIKDFSQMEFKILNADNFSVDSGEDFLFSVKGEGEVE